MRASHPPALAARLLERLLSGPHREALAGDLIEQYRQGRSGAWYWRQVLAAIASGAQKEVRDHKVLAARSVVIGLAIYLVSAFPVNWLARWLAGGRIAPVVWLQTWLLETGHDSLAFWWGQLFPNRLLVYIACAVSGWIVARLHPAHRFAMVCIYSASVLLFESVHVSVGLLLDGGRHQITAQALLIGAFLLIGRPLCIAIGGLSALFAGDPPSIGSSTMHA